MSFTIENDPPPIERTLSARGRRYGPFTGHARITQAIKRAMVDSPNWAGLSDDKKEALEMLAHKVGRILNGDPEYHDSWHDIIGYVRLIENTLTAPETVLEPILTREEQLFIWNLRASAPK